ncbi:uncharacterized protein LOC8024773 [Ixodes scapularis]|uniref:uncharacterized protein LOC8024773 n=1 Tax=Ixodes scapularis TaxID=6945 RepID=UPI001C380598|nr:uncharacterized protein LOC8024773 [Ixodes scapularis]
MLPSVMDSAKTKTFKKEKTSSKSEAGSACPKEEHCKLEAGDSSVIDISHLSNGVDKKNDATGSENMGMFSGSLEADAKPAKNNWMKSHIEQSISEDSRKKIAAFIEDVGQLSDIEKLFLYLQLPTGTPVETDPLKQKCPGNPLGKKADAEVAQTYTWIQSHLEEDSEVSLPKQEVYEEYRGFFEKNKIEPLCAADFGKVMKHVFPSVRPRRLGTRGNSRYCYSGLRKKCEMKTPKLPDLLLASDDIMSKEHPRDGTEEEDASQAAWHLIREWAEKLLSRKFGSVQELARHLVDSMFVDGRSVAAFTLLSTTKGSSDGGAPAAVSSRTPGKRREAQQQLQRKLQEKKRLGDQKRRAEQRPPHATPPAGGCPDGRRRTPQQRRDGSCLGTPDPGPPPDPGRRVKEEPLEAKLQNSNIIFVPTVQSLQLGSQEAAQSGGLASGCKYKKIQPKPACRGAAVVVHFGREAGLTEVTTPSPSPVVLCAEAGGEAASKHVTNGADWEPKSLDASVGTMKRHSEEGEALLRKRRHTDGGGKPNGPAAGLENAPEKVKEEMCVVHLEKEALNDYYGNTSNDYALMEKLCREEFASGGTNLEVSGLTTGDLGKMQCAESKTAQLSQLRMLLERNLPNSYQRKDSKDSAKQNAVTESEWEAATLLGQLVSKQASLPQSNNLRTGTVHWKTTGTWATLAAKSLLQKDDPCLGLVEGRTGGLDFARSESGLQVSLDRGPCMPGQISLPPVPCSPSSARKHFFTPISPQTTPLPEGGPLPALSSPLLAPTADMVSVAVGTSSQPPSATSSPFVSPRGTPVPWTRSRHGSGQSAYSSTARQTPFQALDSGVSSVSSSPFVSPQSTPVTTVRGRHCTGYNPSKALANGYGPAGRARHSSGPGGPVSSHLACPRSAPLSPLVGESSTQTCGFIFPSLGETPTGLRSRHNSASSVAPPSPQSAPPSPLVACPPQPSLDEGPALGDCSLGALASDTDSGLGPSAGPEWMSLVAPREGFGGPPAAGLWPHGRQRHASGPVLNQRVSFAGTDPFSREIQELLKDNTMIGGGTAAGYRSRSVPVHRMLVTAEELEALGNPAAEDAVSKSYPATPSAAQCFSFPAVGASQQPACDGLGDAYAGAASGDALTQQDDVFLAVASAADWNSGLENEAAMKFGEGDDFDAELQSTLEDLKDCDEFSKFAKELDFTPDNEDDEMA